MRLELYLEGADPYSQGWNDATRAMASTDVVQVVRCKDCKWYDMTDPSGTLTPNAYRCKRVTRLWIEKDAYCSYGERREDG